MVGKLGRMLGVGKHRSIDLFVATMPLYLFPLSFIVLREIFIVSMAISTMAMGTASLLIMMRRKILQGVLVKGPATMVAISSMIAAAALYALFIAGGYLSTRLGLWGYVDMVYTSITASIGSSQALLPAILAVIGTMEEIFWRGYIQSHIIEKIRRLGGLSPVVLSSAYYTLAHTPTLNPPLIVGAFLVGIVTGYVAARQGVLGSIVAHVVWLELIVVYVPATSVLRIIGAI